MAETGRSLAFPPLARLAAAGARSPAMAAWLLHVAWDVAHHLWGAPIVPIVPTSSAGCAVTDSLLALWFWFGAPTIGPRR